MKIATFLLLAALLITSMASAAYSIQVRMASPAPLLAMMLCNTVRFPPPCSNG